MKFSRYVKILYEKISDAILQEPSNYVDTELPPLNKKPKQIKSIGWVYMNQRLKVAKFGERPRGDHAN